MGFGVNCHRLGPVFRRQSFDLAELVRGIFMINVNLASSGRNEKYARRRFEHIGIDPCADRE